MLLVLRLIVVPLLLVGRVLIIGLLIVGLLAQTTVRKAAAPIIFKCQPLSAVLAAQV